VGVDPDRQMNGDPSQGFGGVNEATRQVENIARVEGVVGVRRLARARLDRGAMLRPRMSAKRIAQDRLVDHPSLGTGDLKHEDVMHVVVRGKSLRLLRGDVGVDLNRMAELLPERTCEGNERWPESVQRLEDEGVARRE